MTINLSFIKDAFFKESSHPLPQESIFLIEKRMQTHRIVVTVSYLLLGCFAYGVNAIEDHIFKVLPAIALLPLSSLLSLWLIQRTHRFLSRITAGSLVIDTLLISWVIFWTGGITSPCLPFYLTTVMAASFRFGPQGSLFYAFLAMICYLAIGVPPLNQVKAIDNLSHMTIRILFLFAAAGFGIRALHQKMGRYRRERALRKELEKANQELTAAYKDLQTAQDQLLHAQKLASIGRLVAGVAHEINNPISFIFGNMIHLETYVERLKNLLAFDDELLLPETVRRQRSELKKSIDYDYLLEDLNQVIKASREGSERIQKIVADLLDFSRMHKGPFQKIRIESPLENALIILTGRLNDNITLIREYQDDCTIEGDGHELSQLFMNLLTNAADAVAEKGILWIRSYYASDNGRWQSAIIEIEDNGPGIPPENLERIFEPFFTTKEIGKGTGLGLAIAYSIARRHKGNLSVQSAEGKGTLFRVTLPALC